MSSLPALIAEESLGTLHHDSVVCYAPRPQAFQTLGIIFFLYLSLKYRDLLIRQYIELTSFGIIPDVGLLHFAISISTSFERWPLNIISFRAEKVSSQNLFVILNGNPLKTMMMHSLKHSTTTVSVTASTCPLGD